MQTETLSVHIHKQTWAVPYTDKQIRQHIFPVHKHHQFLKPSRCISKSPQVTSTMHWLTYTLHLQHLPLPANPTSSLPSHPRPYVLPTPHPPPTSVCAVAETKPLVDMKITAAVPSNIQFVSSLIPTGLAIDNRKQTPYTMQREEMNVS